MSLLLIQGIIILLIITVLIVMAVLLIPVGFHAESSGSVKLFHISFAVSWLILKMRYSLEDSKIEFFLFNRRLIALQSKKKQPEIEEKPGISAPVSKPSSINSFIKKYDIPSRIFNKIKRLGGAGNIKYSTNLIGPVIAFFKGVVSTFKFKHIEIDTTYGLDDPAHTGIITGFLYTILGPLDTKRHIRLNPIFTGPALNWDIKAYVIFKPIQIFSPAINFTINPKVIKSVWGIIRS